MANYLLKFKGKYRILADIDKRTNDFVRDENDNISDSDIYISCQNGNRIMTYGHIDNKKAVWLIAYIPSIGRGHNIIKAVKEQGIDYIDYVETDEEIEFKFKAKDIEPIATLLKAKTSGASISPFSTKNLPKAKNVEIPTDKINAYKAISSQVDKGDLLLISRVTTSFLEDILQKKCRKESKTFDYKSDMKKCCMSRLTKEYIYHKGFWEEYIEYFKTEVDKFYNK